MRVSLKYVLEVFLIPEWCAVSVLDNVLKTFYLSKSTDICAESIFIIKCETVLFRDFFLLFLEVNHVNMNRILELIDLLQMFGYKLVDTPSCSTYTSYSKANWTHYCTKNTTSSSCKT